MPITTPVRRRTALGTAATLASCRSSPHRPWPWPPSRACGLGRPSRSASRDWSSAPASWRRSPTSRRRCRRRRRCGGSTTTRTTSCASGPGTRCPATARVSTPSASSSSASSSRSRCGCTSSRAASRANPLLARLLHDPGGQPGPPVAARRERLRRLLDPRSRLADEARRREFSASFLGGAYFRAVSGVGRWGMSARGVAVDVGGAGPEEFPDFVAHWITPAASEDDPVVVHSLLDGPSLAGAFRFAIRRTAGTVVEVENRLFVRRDVGRLGIAPLTSMFWFGEHGRERRRTGAPRCTTRTASPSGPGRASGFGGRSTTRPGSWSRLPRRRPEGLRPRPARPRLRPLPGRGRLREAAERVVEPLAAGARGWCSWSNPDRRRDNNNLCSLLRPGGRPGARQRHAHLPLRSCRWLDAEATHPARPTRRAASQPRQTAAASRAKAHERRSTSSESRPSAGAGLAPARRASPAREPVVPVSRSSVFTRPTQSRSQTATPQATRRMSFDLTTNDKKPVEVRAFLRGGAGPLSETWLYLFEPTPTA